VRANANFGVPISAHLCRHDPNSTKLRGLLCFVLHGVMRSILQGMMQQMLGTTISAASRSEPLGSAAAGQDAADARAGGSGASVVRSVFLFTDGQANAGVTSQADIVRAMRTLLDDPGSKRGNLKVHTFGFGADHHEGLLQAIAQAAAGNYFFIESPEHIPEAFADALGGLLSVCAQNVELRAAPRGGVQLTNLHTGFPMRRDGADFVVTMPDLYAEESKDLILELTLPAVAQACEQVSAEVSVRFVDVLCGALKTRCTTLSLRRSDELPAPATCAVRFAVHRARIQTAARMRNAIELANRGQYEHANATLVQQIDSINDTLNSLAICEASDVSSVTASEATCVTASEATAAAPGDVADAEPSPADMLRALRTDLERCATEVAQPATWHSTGSKFASAQAYSHACQRSVGIHSSRPTPAASVSNPASFAPHRMQTQPFHGMPAPSAPAIVLRGGPPAARGGPPLSQMPGPSVNAGDGRLLPMAWGPHGSWAPPQAAAPWAPWASAQGSAPWEAQAEAAWQQWTDSQSASLPKRAVSNVYANSRQRKLVAQSAPPLVHHPAHGQGLQ
jgi:von Willebrand factor type A domain